MTATIINLRKARKAKTRNASEQQAEQNRTKFGEKSSIRKARGAEENRKTKVFEAGRIETVQTEPPE